jgi:hypothetical protein
MNWDTYFDDKVSLRDLFYFIILLNGHNTESHSVEEFDKNLNNCENFLYGCKQNSKQL